MAQFGSACALLGKVLTLGIKACFGLSVENGECLQGLVAVLQATLHSSPGDHTFSLEVRRWDGRTGACPDASVKSHATLGRYQHSEMSQDVKAVFECASLTCQGFGWQSGTRDRTARSPGEDEG